MVFFETKCKFFKLLFFDLQMLSQDRRMRLVLSNCGNSSLNVVNVTHRIHVDAGFVVFAVLLTLLVEVAPMDDQMNNFNTCTVKTSSYHLKYEDTKVNCKLQLFKNYLIITVYASPLPSSRETSYGPENYLKNTHEIITKVMK